VGWSALCIRAVIFSNQVFAVRKVKRTGEELRALIRERATRFGPWPLGMTVLVYPSNDSWEVSISPGKTPSEEEYRISALWVAVQMQAEFDLRAYAP
jgi:hypothetical protein